jgi:thymidylate kinase
VNATANEFWQKHRGLVWSNPNADDSTHIRAVLLRPRFSLLLDIAVKFGVERIRSEWSELRRDETREVLRAREVVERILSNIEKGFTLAAARN